MGDASARVGGDGAATAALDRFFDVFYRQRPVTATFTGIHAHDHRLPDWSNDGLAQAVDEMRDLRRGLDEAGRVPDDQVRAFPHEVDLALADAALEIALAEHDNGHFVHANPSLWTGEAIFGVLSLLTRDFAPLAERLQQAQARLEAIPAFLAGAERTMLGVPDRWQTRARSECEVAARLLRESLAAWVRDLAASSAPAIDAAGWVQSAERAAQAFDEFSERVGARHASAMYARHAALSSPPGDSFGERAGAELLTLLLRRGHWVTTPLQELLGEAEDALAEARRRLDAMCASYGGWPAVQDRLAADHPPADRYFERFHEKWQQCRDAAERYGLVTWPDAPLRYVPYPSHVRDAAPRLYYLHYRSPAPFDPFGTFDYVVPGLDGLTPDQADARLRQWNESVITLNHVVHHGAIGHHVQNHHAYRGSSRIGRVAAVDAASRIAMFSGGSMAEGWACYVCDLMEEVGFLTPLESIAQQHTRVRIAARAVADLRLHTGLADIASTTSFYEDHAAMSSAAAHGEAVRNSMFPGTAVMYWLGTRGIHRLRAEVWRREGAAFSMKRFHDRFLSHGAIPVALISRLMLGEAAQ